MAYTQRSLLLQVAVQSDGSWSEFDDVIVEAGAQIQQDMIVNVTSASLYLLAANKVIHVCIC